MQLVNTKNQLISYHFAAFLANIKKQVAFWYISCYNEYHMNNKKHKWYKFR